MVEKLSDKWVLLMVVTFLGLTVLTCAVGGFYLAATDHTIPDPVIALGSGALGGLVGVLVKTD